MVGRGPGAVAVKWPRWHAMTSLTPYVISYHHKTPGRTPSHHGTCFRHRSVKRPSSLAPRSQPKVSIINAQLPCFGQGSKKLPFVTGLFPKKKPAGAVGFFCNQDFGQKPIRFEILAQISVKKNPSDWAPPRNTQKESCPGYKTLVRIRTIKLKSLGHSTRRWNIFLQGGVIWALVVPTNLNSNTSKSKCLTRSRPSLRASTMGMLSASQ